MLLGEDKPGIGGEPLLGQKPKPKYSVFPKGIGSDAPSWVAFDKQVRSKPVFQKWDTLYHKGVLKSSQSNSC